MSLDIIALGEPLLEFNATEAGNLREVRSYEVGWGGDTSNFCIAASRMGSRVGYITRLGSDEFGQIFQDLWQREGVDTRHVMVEQGAGTGIYFIARQGTSHSFTYYRKDSAASHLAPQDIPETAIQAAKVFHVSGITQAISNSACDAAFTGITVARERGVLVSYDPNIRTRLWNIHRARAIVMQSIRLADFIFPSLEDAQHLTGRDDPDWLAAFLLDQGPKVVALKLGAQGVILKTADFQKTLAPIEVPVVDTTGAGDTFDGAFISAHLKGKSYEECARFANVAAGLATTGWGAVQPIPGAAEVEAYLLHYPAGAT